LGKRYELVEKKLEIHMTEEDYDRYKAITDTENGSGTSMLRKLLPTSATTSIDSSIKCQELGIRSLRAFKIEEESPGLWAQKRMDSKPKAANFVGFERTVSPGAIPGGIKRQISQESKNSKGEPKITPPGGLIKRQISQESKNSKGEPKVKVEPMTGASGP